MGVVVDPIGVSIWQMAAHPLSRQQFNPKPDLATDKTLGDGGVTSESDVEAGSLELYEEPITESASIAIACDEIAASFSDLSLYTSN
ncbi:hypothetical protein Hanom_Chr06g00540211 [Helianthus anomalus]